MIDNVADINEAKDHMIKAIHKWRDDPSSINWLECIVGMDRISDVAEERWEKKYGAAEQIERCDWTDEQESEMTLQLEALINAIRESDQICNPGYRQASFYSILEAGIRYIQDMMIRWYKDSEEGEQASQP